MSILKIIILLLIIASILYLATSKNEVKLIPLNVLLGNPSKAKITISPDGKKIAYLAAKNGILNIFVKSIDKNDDKVVTNDTVRGISDYFWTFDNKNLLYLRDTGGDENWHLFKVDLENKTEQDLTPFEGVQARVIDYIPKYPDKLIIALNKRDKQYFDLYELNLGNCELKLLEQNPGKIIEWGLDKDLKVKLGLESLNNGGYNLLIKENHKWIPLINWSFEDGLPEAFQLTKDGKHIYLIDSKDSNTLRLRKLNIDTKESINVMQDPIYDVKNVLFDLKSYEPIAANIYSSRSNWKIIDKDFEIDFENIKKLDTGDFSIERAKDKDDKFWIVYFTKDNSPVSYWFYNRETKKGHFLYYTRPELLKYKLAKVEPISFVSRDGITIHGYITYPLNKERKNLPLILNVHGGPWTRDSWGFHPEVQWMANRGYAILQINYRGSTGYGKKFKDLGNKQWGLNMQNDLTDAVQWAIDKEIADPKKVAIYGGSYGGFAALAGATFTPDLYCCAVDIVGVSNIITLINSIPPYWAPYLTEFHKRVGNPETEKAFLESVSPLFSAHKIKIPLLIAHGANDPRVKLAESDQIVKALKENNIEYKYMVFKDEGHGFCKAENRLKFYLEADKFLAKYLGGRSE